MKTREQMIEEYRSQIEQQNNLQQNETAAGANVMAAYHQGKKEAFKQIANYLSMCEIKDD